MKPIIEYSDFRQYMRDYYEERKRRSAFSWREFSKITGFSSCSYMKVVCDGKSKLSKIGVERVGAAMGLAGFEMEYFRAMVQYGQAESAEAKNEAFRNMLAIAKVHAAADGRKALIQRDVFNAVLAVDHAHGRSPALNTVMARTFENLFASRFLSLATSF